MKQIPNTEHILVLRTDFSNQAAWDLICAAIRRPDDVYHFIAYVDFLDDEGYSGINKEQLLALIPNDYNQTYIIVVDQTTISHPEHSLLIVDLFEENIGNEFRAIPSQIQWIENNLSIGNMDFEEFAEAVDEDGIFRGFPRE
jgi:hypothetical protein